MSVDVYVHPDTVDITFGGLDQYLCFHDRLILPIDEVTSATVVGVDRAAEDRALRLVGAAYWPGWIATGTFGVRNRPGARQLWCVYRDPEVLMIELDRSRLKKVVLQHPDRHNLAWLIGERIGPR